MGIRGWKICRSTKNITSHFNYHLTLPQNQSWKEYMIPEKVVSHVISCLCGDQFLTGSLRKVPLLGRSIGIIGTVNANKVEHSHRLIQSIHVNKQPSSHHSPPGCSPGLTVKDIRTAFNLSQMRLRPSTRPSIWLGNKVPFNKQRENTLFPLKVSSKG